MQQNRGYWWLAAVAVAAVAVGLWLLRQRLDDWTRARLADQHVRTIAELPEHEAAALIERLAADDAEWLDVLVAALADSREAVAAAAEAALLKRLERWQLMRAADSSPRASALAESLARHASSLPHQRREFAQTLAQRMIAWPLDRQAVNPATLIAHCETILRLDLPEEPALRLAALEARSAAVEEEPLVLGEAADAEGVIDVPPAQGALPRDIAPLEPQSLPGAGQEDPTEPRRFLPPRGIRISDGD